MKFTALSLVAAPLLLGSHCNALLAQHFTITALGDLVPSGYTGYKYSVRFLVRDSLTSATLAECSATWSKLTNFPSNYVPCNDPDWRWRYIGQYKECGFSISLAHSKIQDDGTYKYNTTSEATLISTQVPCAVGASQNFTCIYGSTGAQLCGLGQGTILQVPVRKMTSQTSKMTKRSPLQALKKFVTGVEGRDVAEGEEADDQLVSESVVYLDGDNGEDNEEDAS